MNVAIACNGDMSSDHFGHCEGFKVYEVEGKDIKNEYFLENPGHKPGFLPVYLNEKGINIIIAGGMGERAQELFNENNIQVIVGASGKAGDLINEYLKENLKSDGSVCSKHEHEGNCGE
ncbi:MAG: dinitrogenase iron-molybdenum cofactor [Clostridiales bacterium GWE2_32_10]|nr:MAG: dinitrogenase iron-molybdenum cofactor [Clostridiales bacterium GWE2_32_10]HBY21655.1 dinitrogenase iron-molybdenum cofactor [Clostridiales bacterium]